MTAVAVMLIAMGVADAVRRRALAHWVAPLVAVTVVEALVE